MSDTNYGRIWRDGLWDNNVITGQMLALCPTLATTTSATNGLGMGLSTLAVMILCNLCIASVRGFIAPQVRIPVFVVIIAAIVTVADMVLNAWMHELYQVLGLFIALIVTNCAVYGRVEVFAAKNPVIPSTIDAAAMGLGFTIMLTLIGAIREILGSGTLFSHASQLLGPHFAWMELRILPANGGILMMVLPPGGFLVVGFLLGLKRKLDIYLKNRALAKANPDALPVLN